MDKVSKKNGFIGFPSSVSLNFFNKKLLKQAG